MPRALGTPRKPADAAALQDWNLTPGPYRTQPWRRPTRVHREAQVPPAPVPERRFQAALMLLHPPSSRHLLSLSPSLLSPLLHLSAVSSVSRFPWSSREDAHNGALLALWRRCERVLGRDKWSLHGPPLHPAARCGGSTQTQTERDRLAKRRTMPWRTMPQKQNHPLAAFS